MQAKSGPFSDIYIPLVPMHQQKNHSVFRLHLIHWVNLKFIFDLTQHSRKHKTLSFPAEALKKANIA